MTHPEFRDVWLERVNIGIDEHGFTQAEAERNANLTMAWMAHVRLDAMRVRVIRNMMRSSMCAGVLLAMGMHWLFKWLA